MKSLFFLRQGYLSGCSLPKFWPGLFIITALSLHSCQKEAMKMPVIEDTANATASKAEANVVFQYSDLPTQTRWELQQARAATAKYKHFENALADGYQDIDVKIPNMGHHYLKMDLLDAKFDYRAPEVLVYNPDEKGKMQLVAVEYAIPLNLSALAPDGFTGNLDIWTENTGFGLWLLHAWVWTYNPAGVFNPTNADVHLHL
jgi:hypothetical protein